MFFHAHPDDEALLTAGTMARLAAEGHRVVLVVATDGDQGLADPVAGRLGDVRLAELHRSARTLGVARVVPLGYADSGLPPASPPSASPGTSPPGRPGASPSEPSPPLPEPSPSLSGPGPSLSEASASFSEAGPPFSEAPGGSPAGVVAGAGRGRVFSEADVEEVAVRLAAILTEEGADLLTTYDAAGGYGHPDHVQVHRAGARAAALAGTPVVLEATVDRDLLLCAVRLAALFHRGLAEHRGEVETMYTAGADITHRIRVGRYARAKRAAMRAHASQATGGDSVRLLAVLARFPLPLVRLLMGTEWYVRRSLPPA